MEELPTEELTIEELEGFIAYFDKLKEPGQRDLFPIRTARQLLDAMREIERLREAMPEPLPDRPVATHGEMEALVIPQGMMKPPSMNRELNRCVYAHTY